MVTGHPADFIARQQEDFSGKTIRTSSKAATRAGSVLVRNLYLFDCVLDVRLEQVQKRAVQIGMDGAVSVVVDVRAVPCTGFIDVFKQNLRSITA